MNAPPPQQPPYPQQQQYNPQQPGMPYGQPPGPPPKKSGGGCLMAILIVGGVFALIAVVSAFFAWRFATSPDGQKLVAAVGSGAAILSDAAKAPGTKELRALGCATALVFDARRVQEVAATFGDAGKIPKEEVLVVTCSVNLASSAPTCDQVASTYVAAVGTAASGFTAAVDVGGDTKKGCNARYLADGKRAR